MSYIVSLYRRGQRKPGDCIAEFFDTYAQAAAAGEAEVAFVAAIPEAEREPTLEWAERYTIRKIKDPL